MALLHKINPPGNALSTDKTIDNTETSAMPGSAATGNTIPTTNQMKDVAEKIDQLTATTPPETMRDPSAANPLRSNAIAFELMKSGMASGQALNQATQASNSSVRMAEGGVVNKATSEDYQKSITDFMTKTGAGQDTTTINDTDRGLGSAALEDVKNVGKGLFNKIEDATTNPTPENAADIALTMGAGSVPFPRPSNSLGMFIGRRANNIDRGALAKAMSMESRGFDPEGIHKDTGFFKFKDDNWRTEIPDNMAEVLYKAPAFKALTNGKSVSLGDLLKHDELYAQYPHFKDIEVKPFTPKEGEKRKASWNNDTATIELSDRLSKDEQMDMLMHELQHAVQDYEGFSRGASVKEFLPDNYDKLSEAEQDAAYKEAYLKYRKTVGENEAHLTESNRNWSKDFRNSLFPKNRKGYTPDDQQILLEGEKRKARQMDKGGGINMLGTSINNPIGLMGGGLTSLGDFNNSVQMSSGGGREEMSSNEDNKGLIKKPPPGALPEEVADDQPTMLSKGEMVIPANVVRWHGLKFFTNLRDEALKGLAAMDMAGQLRSQGDNKNPGDEDEAPDMTLSGGRDAYAEVAKGGDVNSDVVPEYLTAGGIVKRPKDEYNTKNVNFDQHDDEDDFMAKGGFKGEPPSNTNDYLTHPMPTAYRQTSPFFTKGDK